LFAVCTAEIFSIDKILNPPFVGIGQNSHYHPTENKLLEQPTTVSWFNLFDQMTKPSQNKTKQTNKQTNKTKQNKIRIHFLVC